MNFLPTLKISFVLLNIFDRIMIDKHSFELDIYFYAFIFNVYALQSSSIIPSNVSHVIWTMKLREVSFFEGLNDKSFFLTTIQD